MFGQAASSGLGGLFGLGTGTDMSGQRAAAQLSPDPLAYPSITRRPSAKNCASDELEYVDYGRQFKPTTTRAYLQLKVNKWLEGVLN